MATISWAITACNEHIELKQLLEQLSQSINTEDEVIVQTDTDKVTQEVIDVINSFKNKFPLKHYNHISASLNKDFATFKNNIKLYCTKEWIMYIDADEYLSEGLIDNIHELLNINKGIVDVIAVPRINTVEGLTREHIDKWKWFVDENGWVNYPDYQTRICVNKPEIQWINKVHERLSGWKTIANLPEGYDLIHSKTIERQEKQNQFYNTL
jgi:glycosyltransferase involved in cell wall biosynthesis